MAPAATEWGKLKVVDLKAELKRRGLPVAGRKDDLVSRLEADEARGDAEAEIEVEVEEKVDEPVEPVREATPAITLAATPPATPPAVSDSAPSTQTADITEGEAVTAAPGDDSAALAVPTADNAPAPAAEADHDAQKRKRSPEPTPEDGLAPLKRQRIDVEKEASPENGASPAGGAAELPVVEAVSKSPEPSAPPEAEVEPVVDSPVAESPASDSDEDVDVSPALHPATAALYINNFMRPLRPAALDEHLAYLAASPAARRAGDLDPSAIVQSYLDAIKTHAFVVFRTARQAARVRSALHGRVWPDDSNRRPLWVDFVPPESVPGWIDQETAGGDSRNTLKKWEVVYAERSDDGTVATTLQVIGSGPASLAAGPSGPSGPPSLPPAAVPQSANDADTAAAGLDNAPKGPRFGNAGRHGQEMDRGHTTRASPPLDFQMVHPDLAKRRLDNILRLESPRGAAAAAAAAAAARSGDYSKNNNRYTFEDGTQLVDRGPEMFDGIRPPHRERERQMGGGGGRRRPRYNDYRPPPRNSRGYGPRRDW